MLRKIIALSIFIEFFSFNKAYAAFGSETIVLIKILSNSVQQLIQLQQMLQSGKDTLNLAKQISQGINDSINFANFNSINIDAIVNGQLSSYQSALQHVESTYGAAVASINQVKEKNADQMIAEAIKVGNGSVDFAKKIDVFGKNLNTQSNLASPKGAQKLTAQGVGVMIQTMDESLRAQASSLKLQAEQFAVQNNKDKEMTKHILQSTSTLTTTMKNHHTQIKSPRF